ncbi:MAG: ParB/RepB/Spo0J family partition protein [Planctomycetota bacterium]|nr:ParB/RepB/Spo0J family partition protein [Planctomycetota bacterium]
MPKKFSLDEFVYHPYPPHPDDAPASPIPAPPHLHQKIPTLEIPNLKFPSPTISQPHFIATGEPSDYSDNPSIVPRGTNQSEGSPSMAQASKSKPRLGRGLSSLIPDLPVEREISIPQNPSGAATNSASTGQPLEISIDIIRPNPHQPRKTIKESAIAELAASMKTSGMIQPIIVRIMEGGYELIAGERRWLAAKLAGYSHVPAIIRDVDSYTQAQMALVENIQREDLNPVERAQGYRALMEQLGLTQNELALRMGEDRSAVAHYLRLLDLAEPVRNMIHDGRLTMGHAKLLVTITDMAEQQRLAEMAVSQNLSVRNLERLILQGPAKTTEPPKVAGSSAHIQDLEKTLARHLGMRVQVKSSVRGRGRLILHYANLDQFDELLKRLGAETE